MAKAAITDLSALEEWFIEQKRPYWTIWEGSNAKGPRIATNDVQGDMDESWDALASTLKRYLATGGLFHIKVFETATTNHGTETSFRATPPGANVAGIGGFGAAGSGIYGIPHDLERRIRDDEKEKVEMRYEIEGLKAAVKEKGGAIGSLIREAMEYPEVRGLVAGFAAKIIGMKGIEAEPTGERITDHQRPLDEGGEDEEIYKIQNARSQEALEIIAEKYGKTYGDQMLKVAKFLKQNPEMAAQVLSSIS